MAEKESVGAIWKRTGKNGKEYLSIVFTRANGEKSEFIAFLNDKGDNEKRPDYKIYHSQPREAQANQPTPQAAPPPKQNKPDDDSIPFDCGPLY